MSPQQRLLEAARQVPALLASGGLPRRGLAHPSYLDAERLVVRVPRSVAGRLSLDGDAHTIARGEYDGPHPLRQTGTVYVTDRRAVLTGNFGRVLAQWSWHECERVSVISGWGGLRFVRPTDEQDSDAALYVDNPAVLLAPSALDRACRLIQAEGAWVAGSGRDVDAWIAVLPSRFDR